MNFIQPVKDCNLCPRLESFRQENRTKFPGKFNAPVPSFGSIEAKFLVVGLAPGLKGANFTGRPFTGDYAGDLLYPTLIKFGFAKGAYIGLDQANINDGLELIDCRITNAVRCVPPENKPIGEEMNMCRPFLVKEIESMPNLQVILALGLIAHNAVLKAFGEKLSIHKFAHGAQHCLTSLQKNTTPDTTPDPHQNKSQVVLIDSYHCSRYNTNTGRLTTEMFENVLQGIKQTLTI